MTKHEVYVQAHRALRRLRSKSLISGPLNQHGEVCAIGALGAHLSSRRAIPRITREVIGTHYCEGFGTGIACESDMFAGGSNAPRDKKARYKHMLAWLKMQIANTK